MTIMDEICGWEDQEKRVGSNFAACMWIYTKEVLTRGQIPTPEMEEYLKRRLMSIMLWMNWICAGIYDDHELVSESTISQRVEAVMGMELDYKIGIPVCGTMVHVMVFSTNEIEPNIGKQGINIAEYHEAVNMAIAYAISRPFGGVHTPRSCMASVEFCT